MNNEKSCILVIYTGGTIGNKGFCKWHFATL